MIRDSAQSDERKHNAADKARTRRKPAIFEFAYFPDIAGTYDELCSVALPEDWDVLDRRGGRHELLRYYLEHTFERLQREDKVVVDGGRAVFNTGLVDAHYEDIYMCFGRNPRANAPSPWIYRGLSHRGKPRYDEIRALGAARARYFQRVGDAVFDTAKPLEINYEHIICERIHRLPMTFLMRALAGSAEALAHVKAIAAAGSEREQEEIVLRDWKPFVKADRAVYSLLKRELDAARERTLRRVRLNYTVAAPAYYPRTDSMMFILPLYFLTEEEPDRILLTRPFEERNWGATILNIDDAYKRFRLIMKPSESWLGPLARRMQGGKVGTILERSAGGTVIETLRDQDARAAATPGASDPSRRTPRLWGLGLEGVKIFDGALIGRKGKDEATGREADIAIDPSEWGSETISRIQGRFSYDASRKAWTFTSLGLNESKVMRGAKEVILKKGDHAALADGDLISMGSSNDISFRLCDC